MRRAHPSFLAFVFVTASLGCTGAPITSFSPTALASVAPTSATTTSPASTSGRSPGAPAVLAPSTAAAFAGRRLIVSGRVYNEKKAVVDGAEVLLRSLDAKADFEATTTTVEGSWVVRNVPEGVNIQVSVVNGEWTRQRVVSFQGDAAVRNVVNFGGPSDGDDPMGHTYTLKKEPLPNPPLAPKGGAAPGAGTGAPATGGAGTGAATAGGLTPRAIQLLGAAGPYTLGKGPRDNATPPALNVTADSCQRDFYVMAAVQRAWAAANYANWEPGSFEADLGASYRADKIAESLAAMEGELAKARALCDDGPYIEPGKTCVTLAIYGCE